MSWYVIQCKPNQARRALRNLGNQGYSVWCPVKVIKRVVRRQVNIGEELLFPGYLFVQLDPGSANWRRLNSTRGVAKVVSFNGTPLPVPNEVIAALQQQLSQYGSPSPLFKPGDNVRVTEGCFRDLEFVVHAVTSDDRIMVFLQLLNKYQSLELSPNQLVAC